MNELTLVLIIEDDLALAHELKECVDRAGGTARLVHSSAQALEVTRTWSPDLVLLDADLPGEPIDDLIGKLLVPPARVLLMSEHLDSDARIRAEKSGVALVLPKPVDCDELQAFVMALSRRGRHERSDT